ncbi:MAG: replication restart helicase PriA [Spirochaetota bacterium]
MIKNVRKEAKFRKHNIMEIYLEIVIDRPIEGSFTYRIPEELHQYAKIGVRVTIPFGKKNKPQMGYVIGVSSKKPKFETKDIIGIIDDEPIFYDYEIKLAKWMANYYICSLGEALATIVPKEDKEKKTDFTKGIIPQSLYKLNDEQENVYNEISKTIDDNIFKTFLIQGVTGSGKTEVYRHLAKKVGKNNKYTIILVPEISLTPQNIVRFTEIFGSEVAVIHSKISPKEKIYNYMKILRGEVKVVLGARSAVFSPSKHLGLIIIDEEHESSYKSGDTPRYNAKQVAYKICRDKNIPLVLGTATPLIETYYNSLNGKINLLKMTKRHSTHYNQDIKVLDLRKETDSLIFSNKLLNKISERIEKKEQTLIFLNRRGFSNFLMCLNCGHTEECPHCGIPYTYHKYQDRLICHYCGYQIIPPDKCIKCKSDKLKYVGFGTEQVENKLKQVFPSAGIERMDVDTTRKKNSYNKITNMMRSGDIDILVGTQMIAKGMHYPNITLVGVLFADIGLNLPDFRATEKTFSLLMQVSGRAGRGEKKGEVIIQTYNPEHFAIKCALEQNYESFYNQEINNRKEYGWVPFNRLIRLVMRSTNLDNLNKNINKLKKYIKPLLPKDSSIIGPAPCPVEKINRNYRYQIIISSKSITNILGVAFKANEFSQKLKSIYLEIDVDPISMM